MRCGEDVFYEELPWTWKNLEHTEAAKHIHWEKIETHVHVDLRTHNFKLSRWKIVSSTVKRFYILRRLQATIKSFAAKPATVEKNVNPTRRCKNYKNYQKGDIKATVSCVKTDFKVSAVILSQSCHLLEIL